MPSTLRHVLPLLGRLLRVRLRPEPRRERARRPSRGLLERRAAWVCPADELAPRARATLAIMVLGKLTLLASVVVACGEVATSDGGVDGSIDGATDGPVDVIEAAVDASCDGLGTSKGIDSCCSNGTYCNGRCGAAGTCVCSQFEIGGCPSSENCCFNGYDYQCLVPSDCRSCADVGKGPGIESCCSNEYCRGSCDTQGDCRCGGQACIVGSVCCQTSDGGQTCIADAGACP